MYVLIVFHKSLLRKEKDEHNAKLYKLVCERYLGISINLQACRYIFLAWIWIGNVCSAQEKFSEIPFATTA